MNLDKFKTKGKFLMLALDHRGSIRKIINPQNPQAVSKDEIIKLKSEIIEALKDQVSGLLIDPEYGLPAYKDRIKPFLLPLEKTGYTEQAGERITGLEYTVQELKNWGASGAKLLLYFNPNVPSAKVQLETARKVLDDCKSHNLPLFLEIVTYRISTPDVSAQFHIGSVSLVVEAVRTLVDNGIVPDLFKLEYPGSEEASRLVSGIVGDIPWILLTGGESFDVFKEHLVITIKAGAQGFLAGRSLWQELPRFTGEERQAFLLKTLPERFKTLSEIAKGG